NRPAGPVEKLKTQKRGGLSTAPLISGPSSLLPPRGEASIGCRVEYVDASSVPSLRVIISVRADGTRDPLERRWVAERCGVYDPRNLRALDVELDGCDGRLSAGEERPPVYEDAGAAGGGERVGGPVAVLPELD